jgi:DNA topoisomerase IB
MRGVKEHTEEAWSDFKVFVDLLKRISTRLRKRHGEVLGKELLKDALENSEKLNDFLCEYFYAQSEENGEREKLVKLFLSCMKNPLTKETEKKVKSLAELGHRKLETARQQGDFLSVIPKDLRMYLPENIVIETNKNGLVVGLSEAFGNKEQDLGYKAEQMENLIQKWSRIKRDVENSYYHEDDKQRVCALVTALIMETGIRPGSEGTQSIEEGKKIDTFGATTLKIEHITFHRDGTASLRFHGKSGTLNRASIEDKNLVEALREWVGSKRVGYLFKLRGRSPITAPEINEYIQDTWGDFTATDFRKLRASKALWEALKQEDQAILNAQFKTKNELISELQKIIQRAIKTSQKALNHMEDEVTIQHYINPLILLNYFSTGKVPNTFESAVTSPSFKLNFSTQSFFKRRTPAQ